MAITREEFFNKKANASLWDVAVSIKRGNPLPLDADSIFESYAALESYAADVLAYPGQLVAVVEENATGIYYLDQNLAIQPVGVVPSGDNKTIEVSEAGAISLLGAADAANGTLPMVGEDGKLTWKTLEDIGAGDGNDNTTYEFNFADEKITITPKLNGIAQEAIELDLGVFVTSDELAEELGKLADNDTTYSVAEGEKVLKLNDTVFSTEISLKHENGMISLTGIGGEVIAEFSDADFVKDSVLEDVEYKAETQEIIFTWKTVDGTTKTDAVSVADFVQVYTAGQGLELSNNEFAIKIDGESEGFLTVGANGLKVAGVQDAIDSAKNAAIENAAGLYATKEYVGVIPDSYTETNVISYINKKAEETLAAAQGGSSETAASVKQQLDNYKAENDTKVNANTASITTINEKLVTIENNAEVNIIEVVKKNGVALEVNADERSVDIIVPGALTDLTGWSALDERVTAAKTQADKGVTDAAAAAASAATNAEEIGKHETRISALETAKGDHETRIINLENADSQHASEYTALKGIVDGHTTSLASKADQTSLDAVSAKATTNENSIKTLNDTTIPALSADIAKKANSADVYTKTEIGAIEEGKTIVKMIEEAAAGVAYDDTIVKGLITAEENRAKEAENLLDGRLDSVETFFAAVEQPDEVINTLAEIVYYIESDKTGAAEMLSSINANTEAINAINNEETGILAVAKDYTDTQIAALPIASVNAPGLVKFDDVSIKKNESDQLYVAQVSTDVLVQGTQELILDGGSAQ